MRPELELLAKIDAYIDKQLSKEDLLQFEQDLASNKEFQQALQQQLNIREGLNYLSLKQKVSNAYKSYRFQKRLKTWGLIGLVAIASIGTYLLSTTETEHSFTLTNTTLPTIDPEKGFEVGSRLSTQQYVISTEKDTVIETPNGTVIAIPANSFNTDEQHITFNIKEALTPEDIIKNGLSTFADDDELETAGMFHFEATDSKGDVDIRKDKKIMVDVPTNNKKATMKIYDGVVNDIGEVNWVQPKELESFLKTVDIFSLNFYPPKFEEKLADLGFANKPKAFKDSLFYSFFCEAVIEETEEELFESEIGAILHKLKNDVEVNWDRVTASLENLNIVEQHDSHPEAAYSNNFVYDFSCGGIEPSKIKAIWNKKFQNSLMATREFEERLQLIYKTCNPEILNTYIKGMKQPLYKLDKEAAKLAFGNKIYAFEHFAERKDSRVKMNDKTISLLNTYYQKKSKIYSRAAEKAYNDYWSKERKKDKKAEETRSEKRQADVERKRQNYSDELEKNMVSMYKQAGIPYPTTSDISGNAIVSTQSYSFPLTTLGWKNIDRVTIDATKRRESVTYKNGQEKASLSYSPLNINIEEKENYDYTLVYLTSPTLTSYLKLKNTDNTYSYTVNDSLNYNMIIIGSKDSQSFIAKTKNIKKGDYDFSLNPISEGDLNKTIKTLCPNKAPKGIKDDFFYKKFALKEISRRKKNKQMKTVRKELRPIIFPCSVSADSVLQEAPIIIEEDL